MASQGQRYTLCGFSQELDWRPLHFVEPVPAHRICNACGVIPSSTALLPCEHVLCRSCYVHCLLEDEVHACPLDGDHFVEEDAQWIHFPLENLLKRKVQKSMVEAVTKVPTRKDSQYKMVHTTDLYYRGWTAYRAPSTEANLVPEVGASQLCGSTSFARPVETRFLRLGHGPQGRCRGHRQFLQ
nr:uncharacterized protein LOC126518991 isoform X2 [Dermacentor andersoni]XP_054921106.1 uncharacterized protein LOC126518991 isoform X2 [Dermacentor andersoni]XP_054921107.1 uncharacterized protein LOC126518991 isoform X2 [Dermacentor andersoni]